MKRMRAIGALLAVLGLGGCVERTITVTSTPDDAVVWLNGEEIGATPVTVGFTWYGDYEVVLRKGGYETVRAPRRAEAPLYQVPPFDLFAETLWPGTLVDAHEWHFDLAAIEPTDPNTLVERARRLQRRLELKP